MRSLAPCTAKAASNCSFYNPVPPPQLDTAEVVYNDSLARAWRAENAALPAPTARRGGLSNRAQLPDAEALAVLVQVGRVPTRDLC